MIEVELPDGTIVEFPAGTSQDTIKSALQRRFSPSLPQPSAAFEPPMPPDPGQGMPLADIMMQAPAARTALPQQMTAPVEGDWTDDFQAGIPFDPRAMPQPIVPIMNVGRPYLDAELPPRSIRPLEDLGPDESTFLGDIMASWEMLKMVPAGLRAGRAIDSMTTEPLSSAALGRDRPTQEQAPSELALAGRDALRLGERAAQYPMNPTAQAMMDSETFSEAMGYLRQDPSFRAITSFGLRSLAIMAPSVAGGVAGQAVGGPAGAAIGAGAAGATVERNVNLASEIAVRLGESGVDLDDEAAVQALVDADPEGFRKIVTDSMVRAGIIGAADAATGGVVGGLVRATAGMPLRNRIAAIAAAGTVIEPAGEMAGEAGAQLATAGEISPGEVLAEGLGGLVIGGPSAVAQMGGEAMRPNAVDQRGRDIGSMFGDLVDGAQFTTPAQDVAREAFVPPQPATDVQSLLAQMLMNAVPQEPTAAPAPDAAPSLPMAEAPQRPQVPQQAPQLAAQPDVPVVAPQTPPAQEAALAAPNQPAEQATAQQVDVPAVEEPVRGERRAVVFTPEDDPIEVEYQVVEADELITSFDEGFAGEVQPRSRDQNVNSELQIERIANRPNFSRLNRAPETDRGAPVVGPDGMVESGNGRVSGLRRAYERGTAAEYRAALEAEYPEAAGMRNPVVVARRITDVDRADFAYRSNKAATMAMSASEDARAEARMIDQQILGLYRGGQMFSASNRDMIRAFIGKLPKTEQNRMITPEGGLTVDGQRRFQAAIFAKAYDDNRLLARMSESTDDDMKGITNALLDAAPKVAQMRDQMARGRIAPEGDFIPAVIEAVTQVSNLRSRGEDLATFRAQTDAFADPIPEDVQTIMSALYNPAGTRLASKAAIQDFIERAAEAAMKQDITTDTMAGIEAAPVKPASEIIRGAAKPEDDQQTAFFDGPQDSGRGADRGRPKARRDADGAGREEADGGQLLDAPTRVGRRPKGGLSPQFLDFSFTNKQSVFDHAYRAAGLDPAKAVNLPIEDQLAAVKKAVETTFGIKVELPTRKFQAKNRFGRKVAIEREDLSPRKAVDQLLNAYRNLQMLAHIMAVPEKAIGLPIDGKPITLSLIDTKSLRGALGMYSYTGKGDNRTIYLPGMSNSFAHEWGHALDHYMGMVAGPGGTTGLLTRIQGQGRIPQSQSPQKDLTQAFAHVIWSMYGDKSLVGSWILKMQQDAAQRTPEGNPTPKAVQAMRALTDMKEGRIPPASLLSGYFRTSKAFGDATGQGKYFPDPAEMFARAFEAFTAAQVEAVSGMPQAFLTKGTWAYQDSDDLRAQMTFPKDVDAQQFALAMVSLQHAMARIELHGANAPALAPETHDTMGTRELLKANRRVGIVRSEVNAAIDNLAMLRNVPAVMKDTKASLAEKTGEFYSQAIRTGAATLFAIAAKYDGKAKEAINNLALKVGKQPGRGRLTQSLWEENVRMKHGVRMNKLDGAVIKATKALGQRSLTTDQLREVRSFLTGQGKINDPALEKLAAEIRTLFNEIWYDLDAGGVKVGFKSNYLPHIYDADLASKSPDRFKEKAAEVYALLFDREVTNNPDMESQARDMNAVINGLRNATEATTKGGREPAPRLSESDENLISAYRKAKKRLRDLERAQEKSDDPNKFEDKIAAAIEALEDVKGRTLEMLSDRWSSYSAEKWLIGINVGQINDFGAIGPTANFLEGRVLPNEAGGIMAEFMHENPIEMLMSYSLQAQRRAEYAKMFGADNSILKNLLQVAAANGVTNADIDMLKMGVNAATGRMMPAGTGWQNVKTTTFTLGNMAMLGMAAFSSLAEPLTTGLRTGQMRDSLTTMTQTIVNLARSGKRAELMDLARTIGLILPYAQDSMMQNRLGMDVLNNRSGLQAMTGRFFVLNGLTPLTHYQRAMILPVANSFLIRLLRADVDGRRGLFYWLRDKIDGKEGAFADKELNELGIAKNERAALLDWLTTLDGAIPMSDDLYGPDGQSMHKAGELWSRAVYRFATETIQDPLKTDRTFMANHPNYAAMYGIMSFIDAFTRNVLFRNLEKGLNEGDGRIKSGAKITANAALMALPMGALIAGQVIFGILREAINNADKMREIEEDDEKDLTEWLIERGLFRSGVFGRLDPVMNVIYGVRYNTDIASMHAGPYLGYFAKQIQQIVNASVGRNDETTNTAEVNMMEAAYRLSVQPVATAILSSLAYGRASIWAGRTALLGVSNYGAATDFSEMLLGEKGSKHVGDPRWEMGGADGTSAITRRVIRPTLEAIRGQ